MVYLKVCALAQSIIYTCFIASGQSMVTRICGLGIEAHGNTDGGLLRVSKLSRSYLCSSKWVYGPPKNFVAFPTTK